MTSADRVRIFLRLEMAEALRSRWLLLVAVVYALVFGAFVWLGLRESSVLGFTGVSRVVLNVSHAVVIAVPLVALVSTSQTVVHARSAGFFELMLSQPARRTDWLAAAVLSRLAVVVGPLVVLLLVALIASAASGQHDESVAPMALRSLAISTSLAWAFLGIGFWVSAIARTAERATVLALLVWLASVALHDFALIGLLLEVRVSPPVVFALAAINPVEAARIAILTVVDPELSVLGPVGFWLANSLGPSLVLFAGIAWPALVGSVALLGARRRLLRADLVG
jgi:ABC-2 type transport system permease protein